MAGPDRVAEGSESSGDGLDPVAALVRAMRRRALPEIPGEGRRERKKREMRQQISDVATAMFLERGFDAVRVAEVAEACDVSEKTVFNYFPTKESLLLDREEDMSGAIRRALGPGATSSPVEAMVGLIGSEGLDIIGFWRDAGLTDMVDFGRFGDLVSSTPSLRAAQMDMSERLAQVAASAVAARAGVSPDDPEPQVAGQVLVGLWRVFERALHRYAAAGHAPDEIQRLVMGDVRRAARLVESGLWSFGLAVQGPGDRERRDRAAAASERAHREVMAALRHARRVWRQATAGDLSGLPAAGRDLREARDAVRDAKREVRQAVRRGRRPGRPTS